jgi:integrase
VLIIGFLDWLIERSYIDGPNSYRIWYKRNVKKRSAFLKPKIPNISFDEALSRISTIPELHVRKKAMQLLIGGLRYAESFRIDPETMYTVGKGDKPRRVYLPKELLEIPDFPISSGQHMGSGYHLLSERLKELKLKPHDLRKIRATHLARFLDATDLMKFFGWESIVTAQYYVGGRRIEEVKKVVDDLTPKLGFELLTRNEKRKHASRSKL